ncbi:MAG: hypothetical protein LBT10_02875 [Methanobrevibacter sp.]|nr:hypothetical protein [Methanobrevibacter sp.]
MISSHVIAELEKGAPEHVVMNLDSIDYKKYSVNDEMLDLAERYLDEEIVSEKYRGDALNITIATIIDVNVLVSWNFKHIVNLNKIKLFNSVNFKEGYNLLEIRTPQEVLKDG